MRVFEVGCGIGDVSLLCAEMAGPSGQVVGVDQAGVAVERARQRCAEAGLPHVTVIQANTHDLPSVGPFDAVVGRLILVYSADPVALLQSLLTLVRSGGIVMFHEVDLEARLRHPHLPPYTRATDWVNAAFRAAGANPGTGRSHYSTFVTAGLPGPEMDVIQRLRAGSEANGYALAGGQLRSLLPVIIAHGIATAAEVDVETIGERLHAEAVTLGAVQSPAINVGAYSRKL